jgi:hypothetical protein
MDALDKEPEELKQRMLRMQAMKRIAEEHLDVSDVKKGMQYIHNITRSG